MQCYCTPHRLITLNLLILFKLTDIHVYISCIFVYFVLIKFHFPFTRFIFIGKYYKADLGPSSRIISTQRIQQHTRWPHFHGRISYREQNQTGWLSSRQFWNSLSYQSLKYSSSCHPYSAFLRCLTGCISWLDSICGSMQWET